MIKHLLHKLPPWLWLVLLAGVPRLVNLGGERLWYDEAFTAWVAQPSTDFWAAIQSDTHPPLWSLVQALNVRLFGNGEFSFRLPAAIFGMGVVGLLYLIAVKLFDRRVAATTALLATVSPGLLYFSQDARQYSLFAFAVLLALLGAIRGNWILLAIGGIAAIYTHNVGLIFVACLWLALLLTGRAKGALVLMGVGLLWLPWAVVVIRQAQAVQESFWLGQLDLPTLLQPWLMNVIGFRGPKALNGVLSIVGFGATLTGFFALRRWLFTKEGLIVLSVAIGAPVALALVSVVWTNIYVWRALLPATSLSFILWGYALHNLNPFNRRVAFAALAPVLAIGVGSHYFPTTGRDDFVANAAPIMRGFTQGDVVYHLDPNTQITYGHYLRGLDYAVWPAPGDVISVSDGCQQAFGFNRETFDQLRAQGYQRAWVVWETTPFSRADRLQEVQAVLALPHQIVWEQHPNDFVSEYIYLVNLNERHNVSNR